MKRARAKKNHWLTSRIGAWFVVLVLSALNTAAASDAISYYYTDAQGSVLAVADAQGNILTQADRRPYGEQSLGEPEPGPGYSGHVEDIDSGLVYMQARYYDPLTGRFLSADPASMNVGAVADFNRYSYGADNPTSNIDPDGRNAVTAFGGFLYESAQWLSGQGFDGSHLAGAAVDGYDGQGAGFGMSAFQDVTSLVPAGTVFKGVQVLRAGAASEEVSQLVLNRAAGKAAEAAAKRDLVNEGNEVLGSQVSVNTSAGRRVIDHLVRTPEGKVVAVEVKAGNASRSAAQMLKDSRMATEGGKLVGKNAPADLRGEIMKIETIERKYPL